MHDEGNLCSTGDIVRIEACRPISARKHFALAEILQKRNGEIDRLGVGDGRL